MPIPKIIHYSWLSNDPLPDHVERFINGWKNLLPGYEFMLWDAKKLEEIGNPVFAYEAFQARKWAFAADYIRLYAVYNYGGIWLDSDVELLQPLDRFLDNRLFIGWESWLQHDKIRWLTSHFFGAEPMHPYVGDCLAFYKDRRFIKNDDAALPMDQRFETRTIPDIMYEIALRYGLDAAFRKDKEIHLREGIAIHPSHYFCRPEYTSIKKVIGIHRCAASWREDQTPDFRYSDPKKKDLRYYLQKIKI